MIDEVNGVELTGGLEVATCADVLEGAASLSPSVVHRGSVREGHCAVAGELHQRGGALELGVVDELCLVEVAIVEADRTDVEAAALVDETGRGRA